MKRHGRCGNDFDAGGRNPTPRLAISLLAFLLGSGSAAGYRFFSDESVDRHVVGADHAARWSSQVWGPGETLAWEITPDPDWSFVFDTPEGALPFVAEAQAAWASLPGTDIAWTVASGGTLEDHDTPARDGRNTIHVEGNPILDVGGYAASWFEKSGDGWEIVECDIALGPYYAEDPYWPGWPREYVVRDAREGSVGIFVHEFGHCLGLLHADAFSRSWALPWEFAPPWDDPTMSYGYQLRGDGRRNDPRHQKRDHLTADDVIGASLLRPAPGALRATGTVSGTVQLAEASDRYVSVWALPLDGDPLRDRVGAFSDRDGAFLIEGLPPGKYVLSVQPVNSFTANRDLYENGAPPDLDDSVLLRPLSVEAGRTTRAPDIEVRRGRMPLPPPTAARNRPDQAPPMPITDQGVALCSGVRLHAERPYPAHGPLWMEAPADGLRGARWFGTTLTVELAPASGDAAFDWAGPYRHWFWDWTEEQFDFIPQLEDGVFNPDCRAVELVIQFLDWRIEVSGPVVRHSLDIAWPDTTEARLRFRSDNGGCDGEPEVVCNLHGCGIVR